MTGKVEVTEDDGASLSQKPSGTETEEDNSNPATSTSSSQTPTSLTISDAIAVPQTPRLPPIKIRRHELIDPCAKRGSFSLFAETRRELLEELDSYKTSRDGVSGVSFIIPMDQRKRPHFLRPLSIRPELFTSRQQQQLLLDQVTYDEEQLRCQRELPPQQQIEQLYQQQLEQQHQELMLQQQQDPNAHPLPPLHQHQQTETEEQEEDEEDEDDEEGADPDHGNPDQPPEQASDLKKSPFSRQRSASASDVRRRNRSDQKDNIRTRKRRGQQTRLCRSNTPPTPSAGVSLSTDANIAMDRPAGTASSSDTQAAQ